MKLETRVLAAGAIGLFIWAAVLAFAGSLNPSPLGLLAVGLACSVAAWATLHYPVR